MKTLLSLGFAATLILALAGCGGDDASKVTAANQKAFESASPELQQSWKTALAASNTNGYVVAITTLRGMAGQQLSLPQVEAVQAAMRAISGKLSAGVASGDAAAVAAEKEIRAGAARGR